MQFTNLIAPALACCDRDMARNGGPLPNLTVLRTCGTSEFEAVVYKPVACLVLQGAKETTIGDQWVTLNAGDTLIVSHDLPVRSRIISASPDKPYLALIISLELGLVRSLYEQIGSIAGATEPVRSLAAGVASALIVRQL